jgi:hypothetical protein
MTLMFEPNDGAKVLANFHADGFWEPGKIAKMNADGTFDVEYDDGDYEEGVKRDNLKEWAEEPSSDDDVEEEASPCAVQTTVACSANKMHVAVDNAGFPGASGTYEAIKSGEDSKSEYAMQDG